MTPPTDRFWKKVRASKNGCWLWLGARTGAGYGRCLWEKKTQIAHRVAWQLERGPIPKGVFILHHCDNPACVRVSHLYQGGAKENAEDHLASRGLARRRKIRLAAIVRRQMRFRSMATQYRAAVKRAERADLAASAAHWRVNKIVIRMIESGLGGFR